MRLIKSLFRFLISRKLWVLIGVILLCALIWQFGPLLALGELHPLEDELNRLIAIGIVVILWLFSILLKQLRAARKNRMFVTELAAPRRLLPPGRARRTLPRSTRNSPKSLAR